MIFYSQHNICDKSFIHFVYIFIRCVVNIPFSGMNRINPAANDCLGIRVELKNSSTDDTIRSRLTVQPVPFFSTSAYRSIPGSRAGVGMLILNDCITDALEERDGLIQIIPAL